MNKIELYWKAKVSIEDKFKGLPYAHTILIYHLIARANPIDGIVTKVNYNDIALLLTINKAPGRKESGTPTKQTIRNYIKSIERECGDHFKVISEGQTLKFYFPDMPKLFSNLINNTEVNTDLNSPKSLIESNALGDLETQPNTEGNTEVNIELNTEVNTPESSVKNIIFNNINNNNNNTMGEKIGNKNTPKPISQNFYPSQEIIARAIAAGHGFATDADIIQEFIDKNTAWGSTFADFNPVYLSFLSKHAKRKQQESVISKNQTRSKDNERESPKINSYDAALEEVRRNNPDACKPSTEQLFPASKVIELEYESPFVAMGRINQNLRPIVSH